MRTTDAPDSKVTPTDPHDPESTVVSRIRLWNKRGEHWMNVAMLLRIAAVIALVYAAGHTAGAPWTPATGPEQLPVIEGMKSQRFFTEGVMRTYWDFYQGFGVIISAFLCLQAAALWLLGSLAKANAPSLRPVIAVFLAATLVNAGLAWAYFFAVPAILAGAISACLVVALVLAGRGRAPQPVVARGG
jgi:hypothetical protein